jgi:hypothetical protein
VQSDPRILNDNARLLQLREQIAFINQLAATGAVSAGDRVDLARLTRDIKLSLMRSMWNNDVWGDYAEFEAWTLDPESRVPDPEARDFFERR